MSSPLVLALAVPLAIAAAAQHFPAPEELRREALMSALRQGGYTVILRHARTDRSFNEARDYVPKTRAEQRNLNDDGVRDAALMGVVFRRYGIRFDEIVSSPMYRTVETAEMAAGTPTLQTMDLRAIPSTPAQAALVTKAPKPGTNRLLVTHHFVIETHVPGISPGDVGESEAVVVRHPAPGKIELVGRITLDDWRRLANPGAPETPAPQPAQVAHAAPAGHPAGSIAWPDTHAGHIAREYVRAFNSGSRDSMKTFFDGWMVPNPDRPMSDRLDSYVKLFDQLGPLTLQAVERSESLEATLGMSSRHGNFRLMVRSSEAQPMRGTSITIVHPQGGHR